MLSGSKRRDVSKKRLHTLDSPKQKLPAVIDKTMLCSPSVTKLSMNFIEGNSDSYEHESINTAGGDKVANMSSAQLE